MLKTFHNTEKHYFFNKNRIQSRNIIPKNKNINKFQYDFIE